MTHISKQALDPKVQQQLLAQLAELFVSAKKTNIEGILGGLFTDTETIMFTKRLAIVCLLVEEYSTYAIAKQLLVSDSTVRGIKAQYEGGRFDSIITLIKKRSFNKKEFWKTVELLLSAGLPPRGRGRWKWLYKNH